MELETRLKFLKYFGGLQIFKVLKASLVINEGLFLLEN